VQKCARRNHQELIFNAAYSSKYNPIERLWAIAKRSFSRDCITEADYSNNSMIQALVMKSILEAPSNSLSKHALACIRLMQNDISN
jgi:transposase